MGSAFTPVYPRGSSPLPASFLQPGGLSRPNKRNREHQGSTLKALDGIDEEQTERTSETAPDHVSTSASEASSKASNNSQPPLLEFIGATCMASAWFTSCFPCAVVDINDSDDYVVDKLSRESVMNVMYAKKNKASTSDIPPVLPDSSPARPEAHDKNMVRLPEQAQQNDAPTQSIPSAIDEEDSQEEDAMDTISLNDDTGSLPMNSNRIDSGILNNQESPFLQTSEPPLVPVYKPPTSPPKKKKKFGMKLFGKKKKS